jgi:hypothetical protein
MKRVRLDMSIHRQSLRHFPLDTRSQVSGILRIMNETTQLREINIVLCSMEHAYVEFNIQGPPVQHDKMLPEPVLIKKESPASHHYKIGIWAIRQYKDSERDSYAEIF